MGINFLRNLLKKICGACSWVILLSVATQLTAAPLQPFTVVLDWLVNADHAPLLVAQDQGFFADEGLSVTLINPVNPDDAVKWVALNKADVAVTYEPALMIQIDKGLPLIRVATLIASPLDTLVILANHGIHSINELKGKKIASSSGSSQHIALETMLNKHGVSLADVTIVNVHFNLLQALLSRQVDAAIGLMRNVELLELERLSQPMIAFYPEEEGVPSYEELIIVAHAKHVDDPRLRAFVRALERGTEYLLHHPAACFERASQRYPELNTASARAAWMATVARFAKRPSAVENEHYRRYADFLAERHVIKRALAVKDYAIDLQQEH